MKKIIFILFLLCLAQNVEANILDYFHFFEVDMKKKLPDINKLMEDFTTKNEYYNRGYKNRVRMGNKFKKEFSQTIKAYGLSEGRIKNNYEDDLLQMLSWMPKSSYQYIGPMLHEVPGMPEKILNLPGIKETKNKFPEDIAEKYKDLEGIEHMSPALYFILMPEIWENKDKIELDVAQKDENEKKKKAKKGVPLYLKEKMGLVAKKDGKIKTINSKQTQKSTANSNMNIETIKPTPHSLLTTKDVETFISTIDDINEWGRANENEVMTKLIVADALLEEWEKSEGKALLQNTLKDAVNPCKRLVVKTNFAGLYNQLYMITSKYGYTPEEWAYTCDKTIKAYRVANSSIHKAYAVNFHRNGYYDKYIDMLPKKWREEMYATGAAIVKMHTVFPEDVDAVRGFKDKLEEKFIENNDMIVTAPLIY